MSPEHGLCVVYDALIGVIVGVGKEDVPVSGQGVRVDSEAVVLTGDEAAIGSLVDARLVVATVTVPEREAGKNDVMMASNKEVLPPIPTIPQSCVDHIPAG